MKAVGGDGVDQPVVPRRAGGLPVSVRGGTPRSTPRSPTIKAATPRKSRQVLRNTSRTTGTSQQTAAPVTARGSRPAKSSRRPSAAKVSAAVRWPLDAKRNLARKRRPS